MFDTQNYDTVEYKQLLVSVWGVCKRKNDFGDRVMRGGRLGKILEKLENDLDELIIE